MKSLDLKLQNIHANPRSAKDFILADAKDADMAFGLASPGVDHQTQRPRSLQDYRDQIREIIKQGLVDIMLMSASTAEVMCFDERLFIGSHVTPAARANDTTDIHLPAGGVYHTQPARPFRTATIEQIMTGKAFPKPSDPRLGPDLGLYSITPNNSVDFDLPTLEAYKDFRLEAEKAGFRHFLEVFAPNACGTMCPKDLARFINDLIARTLAGVPRSGRPVFLKIPFMGKAAMEQLVSYDPHLVPGILGGSSGTTMDAFKQLEDARASGARAALYGRKINFSEHQLTFVTFLRRIADGQMSARDGVPAYHEELRKLGLKPIRDLKSDMEETSTAINYGGSAEKKKTETKSDVKSDAKSVDFTKMSTAEKVAYQRARIAGKAS
jgi:hypothetical protein